MMPFLALFCSAIIALYAMFLYRLSWTPLALWTSYPKARRYQIKRSHLTNQFTSMKWRRSEYPETRVRIIETQTIINDCPPTYPLPFSAKPPVSLTAIDQPHVKTFLLNLIDFHPNPEHSNFDLYHSNVLGRTYLNLFLNVIILVLVFKMNPSFRIWWYWSNVLSVKTLDGFS